MAINPSQPNINPNQWAINPLSIYSLPLFASHLEVQSF